MEFMHHKQWKDALFLHYEADVARLQALLPAGLVVDTNPDNNKAYVGVVALTETGITAPFLLPNWLRSLLSMSHHAVNVRTYVRPSARRSDDDDGSAPAGIYFFTLDCNSFWPFCGARLLFHLPYRLAVMARRFVCHQAASSRTYFFTSRRRLSSAKLEVEWEIADNDKSSLLSDRDERALGEFFVERYYLYNCPGRFLKLLFCGRLGDLWRGSITHKPWPVYKARVTRLHNTVLDAIPGLSDAIVWKSDPVAHFSPGVDDIRFFFHPLLATSEKQE